jgi:hypothetical protein
MQFAVALVEYLISGIVASIWATALFTYYGDVSIAELKNFKDEITVLAVLYFPLAYVLGIYVDATSSFLIRRFLDADKKTNKNSKIYNCFRSRLRRVFYFFAGTPKPDSYERSAEILSHSISDAVRTMEAYVSRDRIARGMALNSFAGIFVSLLCAPPDKMLFLALACVALTAYSLIMYKRLRRLSSRFKRVALEKIRQTPPSPN